MLIVNFLIVNMILQVIQASASPYDNIILFCNRIKVYCTDFHFSCIVSLISLEVSMGGVSWGPARGEDRSVEGIWTLKHAAMTYR